jgi:hypothetical protein
VCDPGGKRWLRCAVRRAQVPKRQHAAGGDRERQNQDGDGNDGDLSHPAKVTQTPDTVSGEARVKFVIYADRWCACHRRFLRPIDIRDRTQVTVPGC